MTTIRVELTKATQTRFRRISEYGTKVMARTGCDAQTVMRRVRPMVSEAVYAMVAQQVTDRDDLGSFADWIVDVSPERDAIIVTLPPTDTEVACVRDTPSAPAPLLADALQTLIDATPSSSASSSPLVH